MLRRSGGTFVIVLPYYEYNVAVTVPDASASSVICRPASFATAPVRLDLALTASLVGLVPAIPFPLTANLLRLRRRGRTHKAAQTLCVRFAHSWQLRAGTR